MSTRRSASQWIVISTGTALLLLAVPLFTHRSEPAVAVVFDRYSVTFLALLLGWIITSVTLIVVGAKLSPDVSSGLIVASVSIAVTLLALEAVIRMTSGRLMEVEYDRRLGKAYNPRYPPTYYDEILGLRIVPGSHYIQDIEGFSDGRFNSKGWRDVEHSFEKSPDVFRILILGDSFVEATQVNLEDTFYRVLERRLNSSGTQKFEVIALGRSNSGTAAQYAILEHEGVKYSPDVVISMFLYANDVRDNSIDIFGRIYNQPQPFFTLSEDNELIFHDEYLNSIAPYFYPEQPSLWPMYRAKIKALVHRSIVLTFLIRNLYTTGMNVKDKIYTLIRNENDQDSSDRLSGDDPLPYYHAFNIFRSSFDDVEPETKRIWYDAIDVTKALYLKMEEVSEQHGAKFMVVGFSMGSEDERRTKEGWPFLDLDRPSHLFGPFFEENDIPHLDLVEAFRDSHARTGIYYYGFESSDKLYGRGHWNERGHRLVADEILRFLQESALLPHQTRSDDPIEFQCSH